MLLKVLIIGRGPIAVGLAERFSSKGFTTKIWSDGLASQVNRYAKWMVGERELNLEIANDIRLSLQEVDVICFASPTQNIDKFLHQYSKLIKSNKIILLCPAKSLGFHHLQWRLHGRLNICDTDSCIVEFQTTPFAARFHSSRNLEIFAEKHNLLTNIVSKYRKMKIFELLKFLDFDIVLAKQNLQVTLGNISPVMHVFPTILNLGLLDGAKIYDSMEINDIAFYGGLFSEKVCDLVTELDNERVMLAKAVGVSTADIKEWGVYTYNLNPSLSFYSMINSNSAYGPIKSPKTWKTRYIYEDVPTGIIPLISIAKTVGVKLPLMEALLKISCILTGENMWTQGRTLEVYGVNTIDEFNQINVGTV